MVIKLLMAVKLMESAVSPLARWVIRLEVGPPGQATRITIPIEISGFKSKMEMSKKPIAGSRIN